MSHSVVIQGLTLLSATRILHSLPLKVFLYADVASSVMAGPRSEHIAAGMTSNAKGGFIFF